MILATVVAAVVAVCYRLIARIALREYQMVTAMWMQVVEAVSHIPDSPLASPAKVDDRDPLRVMERWPI